LIMHKSESAALTDVSLKDKIPVLQIIR
jgi:hypothetical protein